MTEKQAVKARCRDCLEGNGDCPFIGCVLEGLAKQKGKVKTSALTRYCRWCLNGHPFRVCSSPDCGIHQFRGEREGRKLPRICGKTGGTEGGKRPLALQAIQTHGKVKRDGKNAVCAGTRV
jgi:hypothetical protein